jgi:Rps23 Pro-64 3,4-dihydroxylase Tpa1-like proline 4-hydroxylase
MSNHRIIQQGFHVGKISELFGNLEEMDKFSEALINLSIDQSKYYTYRHNINEGWPGLENKLEISQIPERRKLVEDNNLTIFQQWYETTHVTQEFNPIFDFFRKTSAALAFKIYDELTETNIHHIDSFTIFEKDDFIKEHTDGANPGRLCVVLIYLSDSSTYNDDGGKLIITENQVRTEVTPVRGNYVILDFTKHDIIHSVEAVKNDFKRFCYIDFIYNRDKKTNEHKY